MMNSSERKRKMMAWHDMIGGKKKEERRPKEKGTAAKG
jgi:hypothetical protein